MGSWVGEDVGKCSWKIIRGRQWWETAVLSHTARVLRFEWEGVMRGEKWRLISCGRTTLEHFVSLGRAHTIHF